MKPDMTEDSPYFESRVHVQHNPDSSWTARIRILRKDTGEEVGYGTTQTEKSRELLDSKVRQEIAARIGSLGRPLEWESPIRHILIKYRSLREKVTNYGGILDKLRLGEINVEESDCEYVKFWMSLIDEALAISRDIEALDDSERKALLLSDDRSFLDPLDPWNLEDITEREAIFRFFLTHSVEERRLHEKQLEKMSQAFPE